MRLNLPTALDGSLDVAAFGFGHSVVEPAMRDAELSVGCAQADAERLVRVADRRCHPQKGWFASRVVLNR